MALRGLVSCPNLDQMDWERKREGKREQTEERGKVWDFFRERSSTFSLKFPAIGPSASGEARSKVALHGKDYTWVPVLGSLDKLRKGRGFSPTCFTFCLRVMYWIGIC